MLTDFLQKSFVLFSSRNRGNIFHALNDPSNLLILYRNITSVAYFLLVFCDPHSRVTFCSAPSTHTFFIFSSLRGFSSCRPAPFSSFPFVCVYRSVADFLQGVPTSARHRAVLRVLLLYLQHPHIFEAQEASSCPLKSNSPSIHQASSWSFRIPTPFFFQPFVSSSTKPHNWCGPHYLDFIRILFFYNL